MKQYEYLELRYYNNTTEIQEARLTNERYSDLLDKTMNWDMSVIRFDCTNRRIPCFIPRIQKPSSNIFLNESGNYWPNFVANPTSFDELMNTEFPTNLQVMVQYTTSTNPLAPKTKLVGETVVWIPENSNEPRPVTVTRASVFSSRYFHCYSSLHLSELLAHALDSCLDRMTDDMGITMTSNTEVDTLDGRPVILLPEIIGTGDNSKKFDIIINQELKSLFGFVTTPHPTISNAFIVRRHGNEQKITIGYESKPYIVIPTQFKSSKQFPFKTIVFRASDFPIEPLKRFNNVADENNANTMVVTDLLLQVDDVNDFYDTLVYQPESYDRKIMVDSANVKNRITIKPFLESADSLQSPIYIPPEGTCSILLQFTGTSND